MEEKKELKIKFKTAVILLIIVAIILVAIFAIMIDKNEKTRMNPTITGNQSDQAEETDFSIQFLKLENQQQNMVYSPLSIKYALNMLNMNMDIEIISKATGLSESEINNLKFKKSKE